MKRVAIGGWLSLIGSIWAIFVVLIASENLASSWVTALGRLLSTIIKMNLLLPFIFGVAMTVLGIVILLTELFRKEK